MDIKIGRITWEDDVEEWVIKKKDKWPLRKLVGFSILGYMVGNDECFFFHTVKGSFVMMFGSFSFHYLIIKIIPGNTNAPRLRTKHKTFP